MAANDNKAFWDKFAHLYGIFMKKMDKTYKEICGLISPSLNKDMSVLELACGTGQFSFPLAKYVKSYVATDFSSEMVAKALNKNKKECVKNLEFDVQDATSLKYADSSFDAVVISNALHIIPNPEQVLKEIRRVLKPNGSLFAPTFVWGDNLGNKLNLFFLNKIGFKVFNSWKKEEFFLFLEDNGYEVLNHRLIGRTLSPICYVHTRVRVL